MPQLIIRFPGRDRLGMQPATWTLDLGSTPIVDREHAKRIVAAGKELGKAICGERCIAMIWEGSQGPIEKMKANEREFNSRKAVAG